MVSSPDILFIYLSILVNNFPISSVSPATYRLLTSFSTMIPIFYIRIKDISKRIQKVVDLRPVHCIDNSSWIVLLRELLSLSIYLVIRRRCWSLGCVMLGLLSVPLGSWRTLFRWGISVFVVCLGSRAACRAVSWCQGRHVGRRS